MRKILFAILMMALWFQCGYLAAKSTCVADVEMFEMHQVK